MSTPSTVPTKARSIPALKATQYLRSFHIAPGPGVVYVTNPKVACSTIKQALMRAQLNDQSFVPANVHARVDTPLLVAPTLKRGALKGWLKDGYVFSFVRNPYARLRSVYLNKIVTGQKNGRPRAQAGFDRDHCPSFEDFILAICDQDPVQHNPHWRPQAMNLSLGAVRYDFVGRLEHFAEDWSKLAQQTGLHPKPDRAGKRSDTSKKDQLAFTLPMQKAVQGAYAADFAAFGYSTVDEM